MSFLNNLRFNQDTNELEAYGGGVFVPITLTNVDPTQVPVTRLINTTAPLVGGGNLSADRTLSMPAATSLVDGYLLHVDWTTFNGKQPAGSYVTALTGDVSASGPGSSTSTVNSVGGKTAAQVATGVTLAGTAVQRAGDAMTGPLTITSDSDQLQLISSAAAAIMDLKSASGFINRFNFYENGVNTATISSGSGGEINLASLTSGNVEIENGSAATIVLGNNLIQLNGTSGSTQAQVTADLVTQLIAPGVNTQTASFAAMGSGAEVYPCDATSGAIVAALPDPSATVTYRFTFKKTDASANHVTVTPAVGQTIDGAASYALTTRYSSVTVVGDASVPGWWIIAKI